MLKLEWDKEKNVVSLGKKVWAGPSGYKSGREWAREVLYTNGINVLDSRGYIGTRGEQNKMWNKAVGAYLGCSYSVLYKHWKALMFKAFIGDDYPIIKAITPFKPLRKGWDSTAVAKAKKCKDLLWQVYNDGQKNILPFVANLEKSPQECKALFKSAGAERKWKTISNNSLNKNSLIARQWAGHSISSLAVDTPTTLIKQFGVLDEGTSNYFKDNFKGSWNNRSEMYRQFRMLRDTQQMAQRLGEPFKFSWSPRRMQEEHDRLAKMELAKKFSPEPFVLLAEVKPRVVEHKGFTATFLDNAAAIGEEGRQMGHCVGGYAPISSRGEYLVYSVTKGGERSSTIGIHKYEGKWGLNQHYAKYNAFVTDKSELELANLLVTQLNQ